MAEAPKTEQPEKPKLPIMWILIGVLLSVVLSVGIVMGTLFFTGFFSDDSELQKELDRIEAEAIAEEPPVEESPKLMETPDPTRLDTLYYQMSSPLTANVLNSRRVMQVTVAVMTHYDQIVIDRVTKHELLIRSAMLETMGKVVESELSEPDFRGNLEENLKLAANSVLEELEDFGGIERVLFVEYLVQ
jgi:flagellar FliL protein